MPDDLNLINDEKLESIIIGDDNIVSDSKLYVSVMKNRNQLEVDNSYIHNLDLRGSYFKKITFKDSQVDDFKLMNAKIDELELVNSVKSYSLNCKSLNLMNSRIYKVSGLDDKSIQARSVYVNYNTLIPDDFRKSLKDSSNVFSRVSIIRVRNGRFLK